MKKFNLFYTNIFYFSPFYYQLLIGGAKFEISIKSRSHIINIQQFFEDIYKSRDDEFVIKNLYNLLNKEYNEPTKRIHLIIDFEKIERTSFYNIQHVKILIKPVEEDFIKLVSLIEDEKYVDAI